MAFWRKPPTTGKYISFNLFCPWLYSTTSNWLPQLEPIALPFFVQIYFTKETTWIVTKMHVYIFVRGFILFWLVKVNFDYRLWQVNWGCLSIREQTNEPPHDKTSKVAGALSGVFAVHFMGSLGPKLSSGGQQRLWSDWANAQVDPSLRWAQVILFCFVMRRLKYDFLGCNGLVPTSDHQVVSHPGLFSPAMVMI